jgi:hypothetical protein
MVTKREAAIKRWESPEYRKLVAQGMAHGRGQRSKAIAKKILEDGSQICSVCGIEKPLSEYTVDKRKALMLRASCKKCNVAKALRWKSEHLFYSWASSTVQGHKRNGNKINFKTRDLMELASKTDSCMICGIKLNWEKNRRYIQDNSPTLDRINSENILELAGIQIVCHKCNRTKSNRTMEEFIDYCKMIVDKYN